MTPTGIVAPPTQGVFTRAVLQEVVGLTTTEVTTAETSATSANGRAPVAQHRPRIRRPRAVDLLIASDPGLFRAQFALRTFVSLVFGLGCAYGLTLAFDQQVMTGVAVCAPLAMVSSMQVVEVSKPRFAGWMLGMLLAYAFGLGLGVLLHPYRVLEVCLLPVIVFAQSYLNRFGKWGSVIAIGVFVSYLSGLLMPIPVATYPWLLAILAPTVLVVIAARLLLCPVSPYRDLLHSKRAFFARVRLLATDMAALLENGESARGAKRVRTQLARLHETALILDARLSMPDSTADPELAERTHRRIFDLELNLHGLGTTSIELAGMPLPDAVRAALVDGACALRDTLAGAPELLRASAGHVEAEASVLTETDVATACARFAACFTELAGFVADPIRIGKHAHAGEQLLPQAVLLEGPRPEGSGSLFRTAGAPKGRFHPLPQTRTAVQIGIAAAIATAIGVAVDEPRFYWAVLGVWIVFMGTATAHERARKMAHRIIGTIIGAVLGIAAFDLLGTDHPFATTALIVVALTVGVYFVLNTYAVWVVCLVITLAQLYAMTGVELDSTLAFRLAENAVGTLAAVTVALVVLPVRTSSIIREGIRGHLDALRTLITNLPGTETRLRADARSVDAALYRLHSVNRTLVRSPLGGEHRELGALVTAFENANRRARHLVRHVDAKGAELSEPLRAEIRRATTSLTEGIDELLRGLDENDRQRAERTTLLCELQRLDESLLHLTRTLQLPAQRTGELAGTVRTTAGEPATVTVLDAAGHQLARTRTDARGGYRITGLRAGSYTVVYHAAGHRPNARRVTVHTRETAALGGAVHGPRGPVRDARIALLDEAGSEVAATVSDVDGRYRIEDVAPGEYTLLARGFGATVGKLDLRGVPERRHDIEFTPGS